MAAAATTMGLTSVFFLVSTGCAGADGFLVLFGDNDGLDVLAGLSTALDRTGMCWSSANRTVPLLGLFWTSSVLCWWVCATANSTVRANRHTLRSAIIFPKEIGNLGPGSFGEAKKKINDVRRFGLLACGGVK